MLILGHRGVIVDNLSQNSLAAFRQALAEGDGFETDAVLSKDGEIFLIHEAKYADPDQGVEYCMGEYLETASAAALGHRRIDQLTASEIRELRLKDGQGIPTLREAMAMVAAAPGKILNIELKAYDIARPVLDLTEDFITKNMLTPSQLILSSFNHAALLQIRARMPQIKIGAIFVGPDQKTTPLFPWRPDSDAAYTELTPEAIEHPVLREAKPDYFIMPQEVLSLETSNMISARYPTAQMGAWVFTEKNNLDMTDLASRLSAFNQNQKIRLFIVDRPSTFKSAIHP